MSQNEIKDISNIDCLPKILSNVSKLMTFFSGASLVPFAKCHESRFRKGTVLPQKKRSCQNNRKARGIRENS